MLLVWFPRRFFRFLFGIMVEMTILDFWSGWTLSLCTCLTLKETSMSKNGQQLKENQISKILKSRLLREGSGKTSKVEEKGNSLWRKYVSSWVLTFSVGHKLLPLISFPSKVMATNRFTKHTMAARCKQTCKVRTDIQDPNRHAGSRQTCKDRTDMSTELGYVSKAVTIIKICLIMGCACNRLQNPATMTTLDPTEDELVRDTIS